MILNKLDMFSDGTLGKNNNTNLTVNSTYRTVDFTATGEKNSKTKRQQNPAGYNHSSSQWMDRWKYIFLSNYKARESN